MVPVTDLHDANPPRRRAIPAVAVAAAVVVALVALVHGRTLLGGYDWAFDDARFIVNNPHVTAPASWTAFFTDMRTTDPLSPTGIVRPLRTLEFALDARWFGLSPTAFRAHSLLWFACGAVGVLLLLRELLGDVRAAAVGAAFWALHPLQTEAADWVSSRGDVACGALSAFAVLGAVKTRGRDAWLWSSLVLTALAALYKESGVAVPLLVVIAHSVAPGRRDAGPPPTMARRVAEAWPWFVVVVAYLVYRSVVQIGAMSHVTAYVPGGSTSGTFATMFRGFGAYVLQTILPVRPSVDWYLPASGTLADPAALAWLAAHAALLAFGWTRTRRGESAGAAVLWFYASLLPVANWPFYLGIPTAERFLHVALVGPALLAALAVRGNRRLVAPTALVLACFASLSAVRSAAWRDDTTLWPDAASTVDSPRAHSYLAAELRKEGLARLDAARKLPEGAGRTSAESDARRVLSEAAAHADRSIRRWLEIEGVGASGGRSDTQAIFEPCVNAANIHVLLGDPYRALRYADEAIRIGDDLAPHPHYTRGVALVELGRGESAVPALERALDLGFAAGTAAERAELVALLGRAADLCEASGATGLARTALLRAAAIEADGAAGAAIRADELDRRVAARIESLQAESRRDPRVRGALAIVLAGDGRLAPADEIAGPGAPPAYAFPGVAAVLWTEARWFARGTRDGFARAAELVEPLALDESSPLCDDARFLRARCAEELRDDDRALDLYAWLRVRAADRIPETDPRAVWAERFLRAHVRKGMPEFGGTRPAAPGPR